MHVITKHPRVSVLLPVRNGLPYLTAALASLRAQTFTDFEVIVVDDASEDGSGLVARGWNDPRIRVVEGRGEGIAHALNLGLATARGRYIARHDADDLSAVERFARQVACLDTRADVDVVASRVAFIDSRGDRARSAWTRAVEEQWDPAREPETIAALLPLTNCLIHGSVMLRRAVLEAAGGYRTDLPVSQDYDLWLRLLPRARFARLPQRLYAFRLHDGQISATRGAQQAEQSVAAKLRFLQRTTALPPLARVALVGQGPGLALYRRLLAAGPYVEAALDEAWDVAVATDFGRLDHDLRRAEAAAGVASLRRVGNFLIARRAAAAAA